MKKKQIITLLIPVFAAIGIYAGWQIYSEYAELGRGEEVYVDLGQYIRTESAPVNSPSAESSDNAELKDDTSLLAVDFESLKKINADCIGWIQIEGTNVSFPLVQGTDNDYYLKHLFTGEWNVLGSIYLDYRNSPDFTDRNSVIYGHQMLNTTMFSDLTQYKDQAFFESHRMGNLITPEDNYRIEFFAGYVSDVKEEAWRVYFNSDDEFTAWLNDSRKKSWIASDITLTAEDRIITLSTCSYEFDNARFVLLGRLVK